MSSEADAAQAETNPYAPPTTLPKRKPAAIARALKWVYLATSILPWSAPIATTLFLQRAQHGAVSIEGAMTISYVATASSLAYLAGGLCALVWIHRAWASIPERHRATVGGNFARVTPAKAVGFLLVPGFNLHWVFAMPSALCASVEAFVPDATSKARLARRVCTAAAACQILLAGGFFMEEAPMLAALAGALGFIVAPPLWFGVMFLVESALTQRRRRRTPRHASSSRRPTA